MILILVNFKIILNNIKNVLYCKEKSLITRFRALLNYLRNIFIKIIAFNV